MRNLDCVAERIDNGLLPKHTDKLRFRHLHAELPSLRLHEGEHLVERYHVGWVMFVDT